MRIPEQQIENIRQSADIVDIISGYIQLKKTGRNYQGLCPFHQEKTPSFVVSPDKQIYHCFGCHAGGNVFKFLMDYKNVSFVESVQEIASYLGIEIVNEGGDSDRVENKNEEYYELNQFAARYFVDQLKATPDDAPVNVYLKKRLLDTKTARNFGVGYAPHGWKNLSNLLIEKKSDLDKAVELGLIGSKTRGEYYDRFHDRLMFPIFSTNGRVIAFGGRILEKNSDFAKYINSPESVIYSKRKSLYGLYHSKEEIRRLDYAFLVEGYMDVISLHKHEVKNVIASSGTALTEEQITLLSRFTKNVTIIFDADEAGQNAASRSVELFLKADFNIRILTLPNKEDPDSFVNKFGKEKFLEVASKAVNFLEFQLSRFEKLGDLNDPDKQLDAIREVVRSISFLNDELKRNVMIKSLAKKFGLREIVLERELDNFLKAEKAKNQRREQNRELPPRENYEEVERPKLSKDTLKTEAELIKLLLEGDEKITGHIFDHMQPDEFQEPRFSSIARIIYDNYMNDDIDPSKIVNSVTDDNLKNILIKLTFKENRISEKRWEEVLDDQLVRMNRYNYAVDIIRNLELRKLDMQISKIAMQIEQTTNEDELAELLRLSNDLRVEKNNIINNDQHN